MIAGPDRRCQRATRQTRVRRYDCRTRSSLSARDKADESSPRIRSEYRQPTWLHSSSTWLQPQTHIILWPSALKRASSSPAPRKARIARHSIASRQTRFVDETEIINLPPPPVLLARAPALAPGPPPPHSESGRSLCRRS